MAQDALVKQKRDLEERLSLVESEIQPRQALTVDQGAMMNALLDELATDENWEILTRPPTDVKWFIYLSFSDDCPYFINSLGKSGLWILSPGNRGEIWTEETGMVPTETLPVMGPLAFLELVWKADGPFGTPMFVPGGGCTYWVRQLQTGGVLSGFMSKVHERMAPKLLDFFVSDSLLDKMRSIASSKQQLTDDYKFLFSTKTEIGERFVELRDAIGEGTKKVKGKIWQVIVGIIIFLIALATIVTWYITSQTGSSTNSSLVGTMLKSFVTILKIGVSR